MTRSPSGPLDPNPSEADPFDADALVLASLPEERREELLSAYLDDALSPRAARHVTTWLDEHPDALRDVEHLRRTWALLDVYADEPVPASFDSDVLERLGLGAGRGVSPRLWGGLLVAAAALLIALGLVLRGPPGQSPTVERAGQSVLAEVPADLLVDVDLLLALSDEEFDGVLLSDGEAP